MRGAIHFSIEDEREAHEHVANIAAQGRVHDVLHQGLRVRWLRFGPERSDLPPLVLLHGGHGSWMHWLRNIEALSRHRVLWLPDLPGFGDSDTPPAPHKGQAALDPLMNALVATLDAQVGKDCDIDLGGFSFGGLVAARLAERRGRIRRLVLVGSGGHGTPRRMEVEMINWRGAPDRESERDALMHNLHALMLHETAAMDALAFVIHDQSCHGTRYRSKEVSLAGGLQQALDRLKAQVLLLWGEFDVTADPRALLPALLAAHPECEGEVIQGAGHWAQYERAAEVDRRLLDFLR